MEKCGRISPPPSFPLQYELNELEELVADEGVPSGSQNHRQGQTTYEKGGSHHGAPRGRVELAGYEPLRRECRTRFCPLRASTRPRIKGQPFPQKEVFEDQASFPTSKWPATGAAGYLAVKCNAVLL